MHPSNQEIIDKYQSLNLMMLGNTASSVGDLGSINGLRRLW